MPTVENSLIDLPEDKEALKAILRSLLQERDDQSKRAEAQARRADELSPSYPQIKNCLFYARKIGVAERVGFEPTVGVSLHTLSKRAP